MNEEIKINLLIGSSYYPVTINRDDEEIVRKAARRVGEELAKLGEYYKNEVSKEQLLSIVAFQFSLEAMRQESRNDTEPYKQKMQELTKLLEDYFKTSK